MYCRNCGNLLGEGQAFCAACGTQKIEETNVNNNVQQPVQQPVVNNPTPVVNNPTPVVNNPTPVVNNPTPVVNNPVPNNNMNNVQPPKKKKSGVPVVVFVILGIFIGLIVLVVIGIFGIMGIISDSSNKLECTSPEGSITLMYNDEQLLGYTVSGMSYDLDQQKEYAEKVGIEAYLDEFNDWFEKNTSGTCTRKGVQGAEQTHDNEKANTSDVTEDGKVIGDKKYGYLTVPNNWVQFYDVDGTTALQYSYAGVYIVTMDYIREDSNHTAKEYAQSYLAQKKKDTSVSGVQGATVKIGKNKEYTAYQVYMFFPSDGTYLVTYWFESEDGVIRYLALEGPTELSGTKITDYLYIPESFSLNK